MTTHTPQHGDAWISDEEHARIRAWEEALLLDDLAVSTGYRASLLNLGLVGVRITDWTSICMPEATTWRQPWALRSMR